SAGNFIATNGLVVTAARGTGTGTLQGTLTATTDRKSTRLNSSHVAISYAVFCAKKKKKAMGAENEAVEAPPYLAQAVNVVRLPQGREEQDQVAVEEALEIRIVGQELAITMRSPG